MPPQPRRGDSLVAPAPPWGVPPVASGMRRAGIPLLLFLLLPRRPLHCKCWTPRCQIPASLPGLGDSCWVTSSPRAGTRRGLSLRQLQVVSGRLELHPTHRDFSCGDISVSLCHLVLTRSSGTCSLHASWGVLQNARFLGFWLTVADFLPIQRSTFRLLHSCPRMRFAVALAVELLL